MSRIADALHKSGNLTDLPARDVPAEDGMDAFAQARPTGGVSRGALPSAHAQDQAQDRSTRRVEVREPQGESRAREHAQQNEMCVLHPGLDPVVGQQFRKIAGTLHQFQVERPLRTVVVTSALPGEGKTLSATNLALTLSESFKRRVLLVDADLRKPMLASFFGVADTRGLSTLLAEGGDPVAPLVHVTEHLSLLPGGRAEMDPVGSLTAPRMRDLLAESASLFDWVILDTPPAALVPDAALLSGLVDGVVFVLRAVSTPSATVQRAIGAISAERIIGVILNQAEKHSLREYGYYHRYGHKYGYEYVSPAASGGTPTEQA